MHRKRCVIKQASPCISGFSVGIYSKRLNSALKSLSDFLFPTTITNQLRFSFVLHPCLYGSSLRHESRSSGFNVEIVPSRAYHDRSSGIGIYFCGMRP